MKYFTGMIIRSDLPMVEISDVNNIKINVEYGRTHGIKMTGAVPQRDPTREKAP